jgi:diguanylate cyclase (GGDEF)-like protein
LFGKEAPDRDLGAHRLGFRRGVLLGGQTVGGFDAVAAGGLGGIERLVSLFEQGVQGGFAGLARRDTDADSHRQRVSVLGNFEQLGRTLAAARRFGHTGVLVYCDLDNFKKINDLHGHCVGDRVLKRVAEVARHSLREIDTIARLGGDEFAMLIAQTKWADGQKRAQTLQWAIENTPTDELPKTKVSLGIEPYGPNDTPEELVRRADMAMYYVKRSKKARWSATPPSKFP